MSDTYTDGRELVRNDVADLLVSETDSWVASVADVVKLAGYICNTDFVPNGFRGSAPATAAAILYGREIGVGPITALQTLHAIHGRVGMSAELMRARVLAAGHELETVESTGALCRMRGRRRGSETWTSVQWTIGDARQAGLGNGDGWKKYPRAMLVARCSAELCRLVFPDVTHGMAALEEIDGEDAPRGTQPDAAPASPRKVSRARRGALTGVSDTVEPPPAGLPLVQTPAEPPGGAVATGEPQAPAPLPVTAPPETPAPEAGPAPAPVSVPDLPVTVDTFGGAAPDPGPPPPELDEPPAYRPHEPYVPEQHDAPLPGMPSPEPTDAELDELDESDPRAHANLAGDGPASRPQLRHIMLLLKRVGVGQSREDRLRVGGGLVGRRLVSFSELTLTDASRVITTLLFAAGTDNPRAYVRWLVDEEWRKHDEAAASSTGVGDE